MTGRKKMTCEHHHGDFVSGYWLCGQCYAKLPARPHWLYMQMGTGLEGEPVIPRQRVRVAEIVTAPGGLTLSGFIAQIANRVTVKHRWSIQRLYATNYAIGLLKSLGEEFGSSGFDWTVQDAWAIVAEDMQDWEEGEGN